MKRLYLWWNNRQQNSGNQETDSMAKRRKAKGKSARNGNRPAPYTKYQKQPFFYGEGYKDNVLVNGVLYRNGRPHRHNDKSKTEMLQAAE